MLRFPSNFILFELSVALGLGLLVGAERERRKGEGPLRRSAGLRTFAMVSLCGFVAQSLGSSMLLGIALLVVGALAFASYQQSRSHDPGLTSEMALVLTFLLGALAADNAALAAVMGVLQTALLAERERLHSFVRQAMTPQELEDLIVFLALGLIVLPLAPDRFMGPYESINWHRLTQFVMMVMTIGALGHVFKRLLGNRAGLAWAGFLGGFASSTATVANMAKWAQSQPQQLSMAVAGALLSTVSTFIQLGLLVSITLPGLLAQMLLPLILGGGTALAFAGWKLRTSPQLPSDSANVAMQGHAFELKTCLLLALAVLAVTVMTAGLSHAWGTPGIWLSAGLAGLIDAHATVATMNGLLEQSQISQNQAHACIWLAVTTNSVSKAVMAVMVGGKSFAMQFLPGLFTAITAVWVGLGLLQHLN